MIAPELLDRLCAKAAEIGDENLCALIELGAHEYLDLAIVVHMAESQKLACLRNAVATPKQIADMIEIVDAVSANARANVERNMRDLGLWKGSDG